MRVWYSTNRVDAVGIPILDRHDWDASKDQTVTQFWESLPPEGILYVIVYFKSPTLTALRSGRTLYWLEETSAGIIFANDDPNAALIKPDFIDPGQVVNGRWVKGGKRVKLGVWVTDLEIEIANRRVQKFMDLSPNEKLRG